MIVIKDVYEKFKRDVGVDIELPKLQTKREENKNAYWIAKVGECTNDIAIISFGKTFYDKTMQEGYLISILYHEFTHIWDKCRFYPEITDEKKHRNMLFPYTEFHAAQIELSNALGIIGSNARTSISLETRIADRDKVIPVSELIGIAYTQLRNRIFNLNESPSISTLQKFMYVLIYNIGYYSVLRSIGTQVECLINIDDIQCINSDVLDMANLLCSNEPSEKLCDESRAIRAKIMNKLGKEYGLI